MLHNLLTISECLGKVVLSQPRHPQYGRMYGVSTQKKESARQVQIPVLSLAFILQ